MARAAHRSAAYLRARANLAASVVLCWECGERQATVPDHYPPLSMHAHVEGSGCCKLLPHCLRCSRMQGARQATAARRPAETDELLDPLGFPADHAVWDVGWLDPLREVPANASWPRLMTPPHPAAVGSLGPEFAESAAERMGSPLRWWQELAATRLLEHDEDGRLVWRAAILSTARQVGKSVLLRELLMWRLVQGWRFGGEPQTLLHVSRDVGVGRWVQRSARTWAKQHPDRFRVREANGLESIEYLPDGSVWLLKSKLGVYGHSASCAAVDEGWGISPDHVEDGLLPTLVERASSQLVLCSTAHPQATSLMLDRRRAALAALDDPGQADLILEWSAPAGLDLADEEGWRMASPYWTPERERMIRAALDRALDASVDVGGQDARAGFQTQWLCRWPTEDAGARKGEPLLPEGLWDSLRTDQDCCGTHWTVAVEDHYGQGGAVAGCGELADGSWLLWGEEFDSRAQAFAKAVELIDDLPRVDVIVGATLLGDPDVRDLSHHVIGQTGAQTRQALRCCASWPVRGASTGILRTAMASPPRSSGPLWSSVRSASCSSARNAPTWSGRRAGRCLPRRSQSRCRRSTSRRVDYPLGHA
jgi:hypothetical protein